MSLSFVLVGSQIKRFRTALKGLAAIGSELLVEGVPERLVLRSINSARSAFLAVTLSAQFFESYNLFAPTGLVQAGVLLKHLLAAFRTARVSSMSFELNPEQAALSVTLKCENGLLKRYGLDISSSDILQATLDGNDLPVSVVAEAGELNRLLNTFQSTLDEITIIAQPEQEPQDSTAAAAAAAQKAVQIKSFLDPTKGASSSSLTTTLQLNSHEVFKSYSHSGASPSDVTVNLKDLKALVALCVELSADVALKFDKAGLPLLATPHLRGAQEVDCTAELILATLQESQIENDEWTEDAAAAAAGGDGIGLAADRNGDDADRPETIAPATTFATRTAGVASDAAGGGAAAAAGGDVTPQGGANRPAGIIRFQAPTAAAQQQAGRSGMGSAATAAGTSGRSAAAAAGGSGGRYSSRGSGLSRLQRLEAAEAESEQADGVRPYSRLTSSMAAAARSRGGSGSGGGRGYQNGIGLRSPVTAGVDVNVNSSGGRGAGAQQQQSWQQWQQQAPQQHDDTTGFASRSLGEYGAAAAAAGVAARYQGAAAAAAAGHNATAAGNIGHGLGGFNNGTDSQADDPEALPRVPTNTMQQQQQQQQFVQQQQQQQGYQEQQAYQQQQGYQQQQQQQQADDAMDSEELLPSDDEGMQDAGEANFGFL